MSVFTGRALEATTIRESTIIVWYHNRPLKPLVVLYATFVYRKQGFWSQLPQSFFTELKGLEITDCRLANCGSFDWNQVCLSIAKLSGVTRIKLISSSKTYFVIVVHVIGRWPIDNKKGSVRSINLKVTLQSWMALLEKFNLFVVRRS